MHSLVRTPLLERASCPRKSRRPCEPCAYAEPLKRNRSRRWSAFPRSARMASGTRPCEASSPRPGPATHERDDTPGSPVTALNASVQCVTMGVGCERTRRPIRLEPNFSTSSHIPRPASTAGSGLPPDSHSHHRLTGSQDRHPTRGFIARPYLAIGERAGGTGPGGSFCPGPTHPPRIRTACRAGLSCQFERRPPGPDERPRHASHAYGAAVYRGVA